MRVFAFFGNFPAIKPPGIRHSPARTSDQTHGLPLFPWKDVSVMAVGPSIFTGGSSTSLSRVCLLMGFEISTPELKPSPAKRKRAQVSPVVMDGSVYQSNVADEAPIITLAAARSLSVNVPLLSYSVQPLSCAAAPVVLVKGTLSW